MQRLYSRILASGVLHVPAILCATQRPPVASGPEAAAETVAVRVGTES